MGGTGANHIMLGHRRRYLVQRRQRQSGGAASQATGLRRELQNAGVVDEIENPNPAPGTNNWYTEDGYGGGGFGQPGLTAAAPTATAPIRRSPA